MRTRVPLNSVTLEYEQLPSRRRLEAEKKGRCTVDTLGSSESSRLTRASCFINLGPGGDKEKALNQITARSGVFSQRGISSSLKARRR